MPSQSDSPNKPLSPLCQLARSIFSNNNIMLAAIISLLLVILFVLLLHVYAKWFLAQAQAQAQARRRRRRRTSVTVSAVLGPAPFHQFHNINVEDSPISGSLTKGLDSAIIAAIPMFIYEVEAGEGDKQRKHGEELECVICLSAFEKGEIGRSLPKCGHAFHVECIDMWLNSHSNCPICRAPIVGGIVQNQNDSQLGSVNGDDVPAVLEIVIHTPSSEISEGEHGNESGNDNGGVRDSVSETSSSLLGFSLKRMLSNVFLSSNVNELDA